MKKDKEFINNGKDCILVIALAQALASRSNVELVKGLWRKWGCAKNGSIQNGSYKKNGFSLS